MNTHEPLCCTADLARRDTRDTITSEVVGVDRRKQKITGVDSEGSSTKFQGDGSGSRAGNGEAALSIGLGTGNGGMDGSGVGSGSDDEGGAGVEDGSAALETEVLAVDGY